MHEWATNKIPPEDEAQGNIARCEWDFDLLATISPRSGGIPDVLGAVRVNPSNSLLATGGISRKIRIYNLPSLRSDGGSGGCEFYICTPAKLSSLSFKPSAPNGQVVCSGDYDGVVTEYDLESRVPVFERDEHGGRKVWSIDYSARGDLAASASDDCSAHVWDTRRGGGGARGTVHAVVCRAAVCSVEFERDRVGSYVVLGCADRRAYVHDLRRMAGPVTVFSGHSRTVAYARFAWGGTRVVSSSVDGCHKMWGLDGGDEIRVFRGHRNERSFVGMDVRGGSGGGLIGCGSESNEVFVYDLRWGEPIWVEVFGNDGREEGEGEKERGFVSAVCWREVGEGECELVAGGSNGMVKIFAGKKAR